MFWEFSSSKALRGEQEEGSHPCGTWWFFHLLLSVCLWPQTWPLQRVPKFPDLGNFRQSWGTVHVICRENQEPGRSLIQLFLDKTIFQIPIHKGARHCQDGWGPFSRGAAAEFTEPVKADSPATGGVYVGRVRTDSRRWALGEERATDRE